FALSPYAESRRLLAERKIERFEQRTTGLVVLRRRRDRDVHAPNRIDLIVCNLREDDLLFHAEVVIATAVERPRAQAAKVADTRHGDVHEPIQELVHTRTTQRHLAADWETLPHLEPSDGLARTRDERLLPRDLRQVGCGIVDHL